MPRFPEIRIVFNSIYDVSQWFEEADINMCVVLYDARVHIQIYIIYERNVYQME